MLDKLHIIKQRFDEVSDLIIQPDIITDQKRYVRLNKEYKDLSAMVEKIKEYEVLLNNIEEAKRCGRESYDLALEVLSPNAKAGEYTKGTLMFAGRIAKFLKKIKMTKESKKINKILMVFASNI